MSIFASETHSDPIPIPFDPPHTITVRALTGRELEAAADANRVSLLGSSTRSWPGVFRRALEKGASDPVVLKAIRDPLTGYDRYALVRAGLVAWSYPKAVPPYVTEADHAAAVAKDPTAKDAIDDLVDEALDYIATEALRKTKPALFHATEEDAAAAEKERPAAVPPA